VFDNRGVGMSKTLRVTLVRSPISSNKRHKRTVQALGLRKIGQTVQHADVPFIRGMVNQVFYLINVAEAE
jgi:large subunit ribosomal protein L30